MSSRIDLADAESVFSRLLPLDRVDQFELDVYLALAEALGGLLEVVKFAGVRGKRLRPANGQPVEDFHWELDLIHSGAICEQVVAECVPDIFELRTSSLWMLRSSRYKLS